MQRAQIRGNHREREILDEVRLAGGAARVRFLAERLGVSEETIRRNVRTLEAGGHIRKVHGGVYLADAGNEQPFAQRMDENPEAKRRIAAEVADIVADGDSLFLDVGSTTAYIAQALRRHSGLFVVTNSVAVAHMLATRNGNRVFMAGGELRAHDGGAFGLEAVAFVRRFSVRYAILSVGAIHPQAGFMLHDMQEAEFARAIMPSAQTVIIAADGNKMGRRAQIVLADPSAVDMVVTDAAPPAAIAAMFARHDVDLVLAGGSAA
ncbi:MAG: DeoR/GlpR transcriptional regulator [Rhodobiaceae bacterium]|nr:DeoR/GlpR transcriptional regulator [Rhodobiaceae bacterium]